MSALHTQALTKRPVYVEAGTRVVGICVVSKNDAPADEQNAPLWWGLAEFVCETVPSGFRVWRLDKVKETFRGECAFENAELNAVSYAEALDLVYCPIARHGMPAKVML